MVFVNGGIDFVARLIWEAKTTMRIILGVLLLPFAPLEQIAQLGAGGMLWVARATGMARSRVEVLADDENIADLHSLIVGYENERRALQLLGKIQNNAGFFWSHSISILCLLHYTLKYGAGST